MRAAILAIVLVFGCHKPTRQRFTDKLAAMRDKLVTAVRPAGGGTVNVDLKAIAAANKQRPREEPPPTKTAPSPTPSPSSSPSPAPAPTPIKVDRVDVSRPTVFVLRGQTHGGKEFCENHTTIEACNSACTAMLRQNAFTKPEPSSPKGCACTELDKGC